MTKLTSGRYARRGLAGGVAFLYFTLVALPVLWFGAAMATDFTRIVTSNRQVSNATQAAALAGAQQFKTGAAEIDPVAATAAARDTYCVAQSAGQLRHTAATGAARSCTRGGGRASIDVTPIATTSGGRNVYLEVEVTARYKVTGLVFGKLFGGGSEFTPAPVTRAAAVCLPGLTQGPTNGFCAHPGGTP